MSRAHIDPIKCLVLAGCTAVGKSAMAMCIARHQSVEIISADSVSVYKGLDLGSAKPSYLCRQQVVHHLLDIADPAVSLRNPYTAGQFAHDACAAIRAVAKRGHLPIVCGGSGMYLDFLIHGHNRSSTTRSRPSPHLCGIVDRALSSSSNWATAITSIATELNLDPVTLHQVQVGNRRRLLGTIQRLGQGQHGDGAADVRIGPPDDIDFRPFVLVRPRQRLYRAIDLRCERMVQHGLLDEVAVLARSGQLPAGSPPALAVGYRQALDFLNERESLAPGQFDLGAFRRFLDAFQTSSRQLARRQLTWFRQDPIWRWVDADLTSVDWLLGQLDLDRPSWDMTLAADSNDTTKAELRHLSDLDREQQRRYVPESVIFRAGLHSDVILRLMAHEIKPDSSGITPAR